MKDVKKDCVIYDSAGMTLEEVLDVMKKAERKIKQQCVFIRVMRRLRCYT